MAIAMALMVIAGCTPDPVPVAKPAAKPAQSPAPAAVTSVLTPSDDALDTAPVAARKYRRTMVSASHAYWGMDAPIAAFGAQVHQESGWNEKAQSPVGAQGLAQFMPATADWIDDVYPELGPNQPYNPAWALGALVRYDKHLYERVGGRGECNRMAFALSAYNGGEKWVTRDKAAATAAGKDPNQYWNSVELYNGGRTAAAWQENRGYAPRILKILQPKYVTWGNVIPCP